MDYEKQTECFGGESGGGWVSLVVGIKEGICCMDHWVWCINNEFWNNEKKFFKKSARKVSLELDLDRGDGSLAS